MQTLSKLSRMITLALSLGLLAISPSVQAQSEENRGSFQSDMKQKVEALKAKLNLSAEQTTLFDEILKRNREEAKKQMKELPEGSTPRDRMEIMRASMEKSDSQIIEILDTDQQAIYKSEKEKAKGEFREKRGKGKRDKSKS